MSVVNKLFECAHEEGLKRADTGVLAVLQSWAHQVEAGTLSVPAFLKKLVTANFEISIYEIAALNSMLSPELQKKIEDITVKLFKAHREVDRETVLAFLDQELGHDPGA